MSITAYVVVPPDTELEPLAEETVLDTRPAREASSAPDAPVQDIVLHLPAEGDGDGPFPAMTVTFLMDDPDLSARVAEVADLAYVASGGTGLKAFQDSLRVTVTVIDFGFGFDFDKAYVPMPTRGGKWYRDDSRTRYRERLLHEFDSYLEKLPGRQAAAEAAVQQVAVTQALRRLKTSRMQVITEAERYLTPSSRPGAAKAVLEGTDPDQLAGPETIDLVKDLIAIAKARTALGGLLASQRRAEEQWGREKLEILWDDRARRGRGPGLPLTFEQTAQLGRDWAAIGDSAEVRDAKQRTQDARQALAELVTVLASGRPVLYRLWDTDAPFVALRTVLGNREQNTGQDQAAVTPGSELRAAVLTPLRTTYQAATELSLRLRREPDMVWRFEPLIEDAIASLHADGGDFAERAALDRIRREKPATDLAEWSTWLGYAQLAFALTGAEPIAAAATAAQVAVDLAAAVVKAFAAAQQQTGEDAFLQPSARLGTPPSYSGALMDALDVAIGVFTPLPVDTKIFRAE